MTQEDYFGFLNRPFQAASQDGLFVPLEPMTHALDQLTESARKGDGIGVLTAAPGAGKTVVCRELQSRLSDEFVPVIIPSCCFPTRRSMLQGLLFELGQDFAGMTEQEARLQLLVSAQEAMQTRRGVVLIVDEAHQLSPRLLEEIRCLTNHVEHGQPLIRVILSGQLPLEERLTLPELQALNFRVTSHATIDPLNMQQSAAYVDGRLKHVDRTAQELITNKALEIICRVSDGSPRCLNQMADACLSYAAENESVPVDDRVVRMVLQNLKQLPLQWNDSVCDQIAFSDDERVGTDDEFIMEDTGMDDISDETSLETRDHIANDLPSPHESVQGIDEFESDANWSSKMISIEVGAGDEPTELHSSNTSEMQRSDDAISHCAQESTMENAEPTIPSVIEFGAPETLVQEHQQGPERAVEFDEGASFHEVSSKPQASAPHDKLHRSNSNRTSESLQELPVDDRYAALDRCRDARGQLSNETVESISIDWKGTSHDTHAASESTLRIVEEHLETLQSDEVSHDRSRLGRMIEALSQVVANELARDVRPSFPAPPSAPVNSGASDRPTQDDSRWRATPVSMEFDVIEPDDSQSHSDTIFTLHENSEELAEVTPSDKDVGSEVSREVRQCSERPYARLFSRIRRERKPA